MNMRERWEKFKADWNNKIPTGLGGRYMPFWYLLHLDNEEVTNLFLNGQITDRGVRDIYFWLKCKDKHHA